jgi:class 3 adenylate cyclase
VSTYDEEKYNLMRGLLETRSKPQFPFSTKPPPPPTFLSRPKRDIKSPLTKKWNPLFYNALKKDLKKRSFKLFKRVKEITKGLTMPEPARVPIGSGKSMIAAIMFFDLENFTSRSAEMGNENTLYTLNIIIPQIIRIIKHWNGEIEKNTGDGVMAIFGTETRNNFIIARDAIEVAMTIRYVMLDSINPMLENKGIQGFNFRLGIDMDSVLIANIGISNNSFLTAVGGAANRACKLQELASSNAIFIGDNLYKDLSPKVQVYCEEKKHDSWTWIYTGTKTPYRFFDYAADWPEPKEWLKIKF